MNRIVEVFQRPRVLLPVVHCCNREQVERNVDAAFSCGADGVFLINQGGMGARAVLDAAVTIGKRGLFVGINLLGLDPTRMIAGLDGIGALWTDSALPRLLARERLYFAGAAFKYRTEVPPERYGAEAVRVMKLGADVVTTSGPATGTPPDVGKIRAMNEALGDHALAIASGITPENVGAFLPFADAFLVATGIEQSFGEFDPAKLKALVDTIHGWISA